MKPAQIFHQYIWIIQQLLHRGPQTLSDLNSRWMSEGVAEGNPLPRTTFNRHRAAILDMFGIIIDCDSHDHRYSISNPQALSNDSVGRWLLSTLTIHGMLADSVAIKERVMLENVPRGLEYLPTIVHALRANIQLRMGYQKFGAEGYVRVICPFALKLFHQRWYLLARHDADQMRIYALDRMTMVEPLDVTFELPEGFQAQDYFAEYFGVLADDTPLQRLVIRAYRSTPHYLRTLPIHPSQRELSTSAEHTDFELRLRPSSDFLRQLLSYGDSIEVMEPENIRQDMRRQILSCLHRYGDETR